MRIIVSLTSYPPRIDSVHMVVESLYRQTVQADKIILYLSREEFPNAEDNLPDTLKALIGKNGFRIEWVDGNLKSHKKYYYALQEYTEDMVITVDDDMVYAESMIGDLVKECRRFPYAIAARRTRVILGKENGLEPYKNWDGQLDEYVGVPRMDICAIGVGGICYPPRIVGKSWFRKDKLISVAENQDDLWLKYNEILDNIPVVYVMPSQNDIIIDGTSENCLFCSNLYDGNDNCARVLLEMIQIENPICYEKWFQDLMNWEEYVARKRIYYRNIIKSDFEKVHDAPVYFYGAGQRAEYLLYQLSVLRLTSYISSIVVSDRTGNPSELYNIEVRQLDEIDKEKRFGMIFGVNESNRKQIESKLRGYNYCPVEINAQALTRYFDILGIWQQNTAIHRRIEV